MASEIRLKAPNGRVYVYENVSYWDKKEKKTKHKRRCIGHVDPDTGEVVANRKKGDAVKARMVDRPGDGCTDHSCGIALVLDHLANQIGLTATLQAVLPHDWAAVLTCAYSLLCNGKALSHAEFWTTDHVTPYGRTLTSQTISDLLDRLDAGRQLDFFRAWNQVCLQEKYYAVDVTSISSYSKARKMVERGYNRDHEKHLGQINLLLVTGAESGCPIYFRVLSGSLNDVAALRDTVNVFELIPLKRISYCMDKGFFSAANIDKFYATHSHFLIGVPFSSARARDAVADHRDTIRNVRNLRESGNDQIYVDTELQKWNGHRFYLHVYFDSADAEEAVREFHLRLRSLHAELEAGTLNLDDIGDYAQYFDMKETPKRGRRVHYRDDAIQNFEQNRAGWFLLGTNDIKDPIRALQVYRMRDRVEKAFDDMKNSLDMKRLRVHSDNRAAARIFIQFIALILRTRLRAMLTEAKWLPGRTFSEALAALDSVRRITRSGKRKPLYTTLTKNQRLLLQAANVPYPPTCV